MHSFRQDGASISCFRGSPCELLATKHCLLSALWFSSGLLLLRRHRFLWVKDSQEIYSRHLSRSRVVKQLPFELVYFVKQKWELDGSAASRASDLPTLGSFVLEPEPSKDLVPAALHHITIKIVSKSYSDHLTSLLNRLSAPVAKQLEPIALRQSLPLSFACILWWLPG